MHRTKTIKAALIKAGLAASLVLLGSGAAYAQQQVNLTAAATSLTLPDGSTVPMWGYSCGAVVSGSTATCAALNPHASGWSPVVITVPTGQDLQINLTNSLSFANGNTVPTSLTIVGQLGGGLGAAPSRAASPAHSQLGVSWATPNTPGGTNPTFTPPPQSDRVQSFATEVAAGQTTALTWIAPSAGTYLMESGTHPSIQVPMGLIGMVVVTGAPTLNSTGTAYPNVSYNADVDVLMSEIDPVQNTAVNKAVNTAGFSETKVWSGQPGACGNATTGDGSCYPPAVNYVPLYYLINGVAFDRTNSSNSLFAASAGVNGTTGITGTTLVRLVNAGLKMHVPSIVGSLTNTPNSMGVLGASAGFTLIAEDGNPLPPAQPRVQSEVFMAAGKTYDVMINSPAACTPVAPATTCVTPALPVYDRELSLSGNGVEHDAGMLAYIGINGGTLPSVSSLTGAIANPDTYNSLVAGQTLTVSDPAKGVMANDVNVSGVTLLTQATSGTVTLNRNGTFTYAPNTGSTATSDSFTYCANGSVTGNTCSSGITATVTLGGATLEGAAGITVNGTSYTATVGCPGTGCVSPAAAFFGVKPPGVLAYDSDAAGYPLQVAPASVVAQTGLTLTLNPDGSFNASVSQSGTYSFAYGVVNSQGTTSNGTTACSLTATVTGCAVVTVTFPQATGLQVTVLDPATNAPVTDYRWIIEEDQTFYIDPTTTTNSGTNIVPTLGVNFHTSHMPFVAAGCTGPLSCESGQMVFNPATNAHVATVCDIGNGVCETSGTSTQQMPVMPSQVALDPHKRYYISVLPGDAANPFWGGYAQAPACSKASDGTIDTTSKTCGHGMGGAPITIDPNTKVQASAVTILTQPSPYPPGKLSVFVFEDDFPLNGEQDGGGGIDVLSPQEPGLGGFQIHLWDAMGGNGDFTGQMTYDMFNQPLTNSLDGTIDPATGLNACPITTSGLVVSNGTTNPTAGSTSITGMIVTCPKYEGDGKTLSPLAGQAVVANLMPGRWGVVATPGADRIARGEEWLQTNTLDGQKAHDSFTRIGEPSYFQEFGPAGYHVSIGFANPAIINARRPYVCNGTDANVQGTNCQNTIIGRVVGERLSRTPDERLYGSGSHDAFAWTQCYVSFGDPDGEDFAFTKCDADGRFTLNGLPDGSWRVTTFDQWNDQLVDGLSTPVGLGAVYAGTPQSATNPGTPANIGPSNCPGPLTTKNPVQGQPSVCDMGDIAATQWETNLQTVTFIDDDKNGVHNQGETGIPFANVAVRLRDGSLENLLVTDFTGTANFNETFPLFSWYVVETDTTRYKSTGTHVVYDVGGPADGSLTTCGGTTAGAGYPPCGRSTIAKYLANTAEQVSLPDGSITDPATGKKPNLRVPGSIYCADADCSTHQDAASTGIQAAGAGNNTSDKPSVCTTVNGGTNCSTQLSSGRIDNPWYGNVEGWQGFPGQFSFIEFGKEPYAAGENGGIKGHVVYASTRPFDDPQMLVQTQWTPLIPHVTINLYQEGFEADGVTPKLTLVDTTQTTSWDDWAQGFHKDANGNTVPNMNCPGQGAATGADADLFFFSLYNQPNYLDLYNAQHAGGAYNPSATGTALPFNSQFKCYDGMHNWNQVQPAPYDGMYQFPSVTSLDPATGKPNGTNCKICSPNHAAPATDLYYGLPMLPAGKYVVEVVVPPGMELVKEEDKNILIGDNFIAPVTQQFGGLGDVFIMPDQASVAQVNGPWANTYAGVGYNPNSGVNATVSLGASPQNSIVPGFIPEPVWPCVGAMRVVPDYISLYPQTQQVSPFAGATRALCDRKEVTLGDQAGAIAKFYLFTSTHIASKFTGGITDDYTSEFDPFSPQFGEKFAPPDLPVSVRDWSGTETNRVYADHWGAYNGMTYSTWEVNPPNPTGYSPTMMVFCMNDPGPIVDTRIGSPTNGQMITDPLFTQGYSQFCYELPFMPGTTQYLDTPVVPTSAFAGAGYNNVDCAYPTLTPAVRSVVNTSAESTLPAGSGPWVSDVGHSLTITALGDTLVPNNAYSGPSATAAPFNQKTVTRHYGFGASQGTGSVTIGGQTASVTSWSDTQIVVTVPNGVPECPIQQQSQYGGSIALCGQLVITTGTGQKSVDAVTVTVGGKAPTVLAGNTPLSQSGPGSLQQAIDAASPGDMIIVPPGTHYEMVLMWKPVRLQGVGAASSIIDASAHPAGKITQWRAQVDCLFGLAMNGQPFSSNNTFDPTNTYSCPGANWTNFVGNNALTGNVQVDRLPLEAVLGWDASLNGNMAELLQEPSLMGALEGAAITVLSKGVDFGGVNPFDASLTAGFPTNTLLLSATTCGPSNGPNPYPSSFWCNPSSVDGLGIQEASQGGGGIFVHAWGHNLQIANNRINDNAGTLSGGINIGQGEFPPSYTQGGTTNAAPGSCETSTVNGAQLPYCHNVNVNVHNNYVSLNSSTGDELFSATPAGAGGVSFCTGADYYKFNYNWVCGNLSSGDGGGFGHLGFSKNGDIEHNTFIFNQSLNPTIPANGGGLIIMGSPDADPTCGATTDTDCIPSPASITPSDGIGPGLVINANLIMGNSAESGTGGGIAFQSVNGSDVLAFPTDPTKWYQVKFTNNIVVNNVAGWDGGGVSLEDTLNADIVNNTIASNVSTATAGVLFNTLGAPLASQQNTGSNNCYNTYTGVGNCGNTSAPQVAGLVSIQNSAVLSANLPATIDCPARHGGGASTTAQVANGTCRSISYPLMANNILWQNTSYYVGVGNALGNVGGSTNPQYQQHVVTLFNAGSGTPVANQTSTGACTAGSYWDIGVRGDTGATNHGSGHTLAPLWSVLTSTSGYSGSGNIQSNPDFVSQYCNGSRQPPEYGASGWAVPPGISDATVPNPIFNLTPVATVDEGNNWVNLRWGPLSMSNPLTNEVLGNYSLQPVTSNGAIDHIPSTSNTYALALLEAPTDFYGNTRPDDGSLDIGAIESQANATVTAPTITSVVPNSGLRGTTLTVAINGTDLTGATAVNAGGGITATITSRSPTQVSANFVISGTAGLGLHNVSVTTPGGTATATGAFTVGPWLRSITPATGIRPGSYPVVISGAGLTGATAVNVAGTGVTVASFSVVSDTSITATLNVAANAGTGNHNVTVTVPTGTTNGMPFQVTGATLTVSGPSPALNSGGTSTKNGTITVRNTATGANAAAFTLNAPTIAKTGGTGNGTFSITGGTCVAGFAINPGTSCTINVRYSGETNTTTANGQVTVSGTGAPTATSSIFPAN